MKLEDYPLLLCQRSDVEINSLLTRIKVGELCLTPKYQRNAHLWSRRMQSRLIESYLLGLPVHPITVGLRADGSGISDIVDGLQRMTTLYTFAAHGQEKWPLVGLEFLIAYEGCTFDTLPVVARRKLTAATQAVHTFPTDVKEWKGPNLCYVMFDRINISTALNPSERIRGVDIAGHIRDFGDALTSVVEGVTHVRSRSKRNVSWKLGIGVALGVLGTRHVSEKDVSFAGVKLGAAGKKATNLCMDAFKTHVESIGEDGRKALLERTRQALSRIEVVFGDGALRSWPTGNKPSKKCNFAQAVLQGFLVNNASSAVADHDLRQLWRDACSRTAEEGAHGFERKSIVGMLAYIELRTSFLGKEAP